MTLEGTVLLVPPPGAAAPFGLALVAAAHTSPGASCSLVLPDADDDPGINLVREVAESVGVGVVTAAAARRRMFDELVVHSYAHWDELDSVIADFSHHRVRWMADELAATFKFDRAGRVDGASLLRFGWDLDDAYLRAVHGGTLPPTVLVPFASFQHVYEQLRSASGVEDSPLDELTAADLLVSERYWGRLHYQSLSVSVVSDVIASLELPGSVRRIVIKPDPRSVTLVGETVGRVAASFDGVVVEPWSESGSYRARLGSLSSLRFHLMTRPSNLGYFFGFDSSDNLVVGAAQPATDVLWVSDTTVRRTLSYPDTIEAVRTTITWQREVVERLRSSAVATAPPRADLTALTRSLEVLHLPDLRDAEHGRDRSSLGRDRIANSVGLDGAAGIETIVERVDAMRRDRLAAELSSRQLGAFAARVRELLEAPHADADELTARLEQLREDRISAENRARELESLASRSRELLEAPHAGVDELAARLEHLRTDRIEWETASRYAYGELAAVQLRTQELNAYLRASGLILGAPDAEPAELLERLTHLAEDRVEFEEQATSALQALAEARERDLARSRRLRWRVTAPLRWFARQRSSATALGAR